MIKYRILLINQAKQPLRCKYLIRYFLYLFGCQAFDLAENFREGIIAVVVEEAFSQSEEKPFFVIS